ncbi:MAG: hypoxanthine phosphoribosyltransferase [Chloroflexota bacterium]|nr:MAG: hypoxanthine phosphoribosyltransferase [Chloroflexota bacterium]
MQDYHEFLQEVLIDEETLKNRISELGAEISRDYEGQDLLLVCILRGGIVFLTDLMRILTIPHTLDFMAVASYGIGARQTTGKARITLDLNTDIRGRNVLLVEDIVDSGHTIKAVLEFLETRRPKSLRVCVLLDKAERREVPVPIDYRGFVIPDKFIFGYGLDVDEYYRNLPFIGVLAQDRYCPPE